MFLLFFFFLTRIRKPLPPSASNTCLSHASMSDIETAMKSCRFGLISWAQYHVWGTWSTYRRWTAFTIMWVWLQNTADGKSHAHGASKWLIGHSSWSPYSARTVERTSVSGHENTKNRMTRTWAGWNPVIKSKCLYLTKRCQSYISYWRRVEPSSYNW